VPGIWYACAAVGAASERVPAAGLCSRTSLTPPAVPACTARGCTRVHSPGKGRHRHLVNRRRNTPSYVFPRCGVPLFVGDRGRDAMYHRPFDSDCEAASNCLTLLRDPVSRVISHFQFFLGGASKRCTLRRGAVTLRTRMQPLIPSPAVFPTLTSVPPSCASVPCAAGGHCLSCCPSGKR
jgi:hypothetical protein